MEKLKEIFMPSLIASAVSVGLYHFVLGEDITEAIPLLNMEVPAYVAVGASSFAGSVAGEFLADVVIPKIPKIGALGSIQDMIVPPAITGLTTYGAIVALVHRDASFKNSFLLGAGSSAVGKYITKMI